jgi:uncharacterized membrane protein YhaH (DUF805 family)
LTWVIVSIFLLGRAYNAFIRRIWQAHARNAEEELERAGARRPILYLRSFRLDDQIDRPAWYERVGLTFPHPTREQRLTSVLKRYGPVLAIGRPGEKLPALGAARFYCGADRWKEKVAEVVKCSQLVIWVSGVTEGLRWELGHLIETLPPEKLAIWAHPRVLKLPEQEGEKEWQRFLSSFATIFPQPLPSRLGLARFFHFAEGYRPAPASSIRELLKAKRYPVFSPGRWIRVNLMRARMTDWKDVFLGFSGRINRAKFWLCFVMYQLFIQVWIYLVSNVWRQGHFLLTVMLVIALMPAVSIGVKRLHDRAKSGWWLLLYYLAPALLLWLGTEGPVDFMPLGALLNPATFGILDKWGGGQAALVSILLNVIALVDLGFLRGTRGPNKYGNEPRVIRYYDWLEGEARPQNA